MKGNITIFSLMSTVMSVSLVFYSHQFFNNLIIDFVRYIYDYVNSFLALPHHPYDIMGCNMYMFSKI